MWKCEYTRNRMQNPTIKTCVYTGCGKLTSFLYEYTHMKKEVSLSQPVVLMRAILTGKHVHISSVRDGKDVGRHFITPLASVQFGTPQRVHWEALVGVDSHTEQAGVGLQYATHDVTLRSKKPCVCSCATHDVTLRGKKTCLCSCAVHDVTLRGKKTCLCSCAVQFFRLHRKTSEGSNTRYTPTLTLSKHQRWFTA
jgi:hypothetical protein